MGGLGISKACQLASCAFYQVLLQNFKDAGFSSMSESLTITLPERDITAIRA
jgi:hypothetical protein